MRDTGWPAEALASLAVAAPHAKGVEGGDAVAAALASWPKDAAFAKSLEAEKQFDATESTAAKLEGKKENAPTIAALWKKLLDAYGDTPVKARIEEKLGTSK